MACVRFLITFRSASMADTVRHALLQARPSPRVCADMLSVCSRVHKLQWSAHRIAPRRMIRHHAGGNTGMLPVRCRTLLPRATCVGIWCPACCSNHDSRPAIHTMPVGFARNTEGLHRRMQMAIAQAGVVSVCLNGLVNVSTQIHPAPTRS